MRTGDIPVLVTSDLAARGLDLPCFDLIVHYSRPHGTAAYLHRAGRTGRAGRPGVVLAMVIGQQYEQFEKLTPTFEFDSVDVTGGGIHLHRMRSREERDLMYRKLPEKPRWKKKPEVSAKARPDTGRPQREKGRDRDHRVALRNPVHIAAAAVATDGLLPLRVAIEPGVEILAERLARVHVFVPATLFEWFPESLVNRRTAFVPLPVRRLEQLYPLRRRCPRESGRQSYGRVLIRHRQQGVMERSAIRPPEREVGDTAEQAKSAPPQLVPRVQE